MWVWVLLLVVPVVCGKAEPTTELLYCCCYACCMRVALPLLQSIVKRATQDNLTVAECEKLWYILRDAADKYEQGGEYIPFHLHYTTLPI